MQYSPKLKKIMLEINKLLKDNDISGICVLHTIGTVMPLPEGKDTEFRIQGYIEYLNALSPSYSIAKIENEVLVLKDKISDHESKDVLAQKYLSTVHMFQSFRNVLAETLYNTEVALARLEAKGTIISFKENRSSDNAQNN